MMLFFRYRYVTFLSIFILKCDIVQSYILIQKDISIIKENTTSNGTVGYLNTTDASIYPDSTQSSRNISTVTGEKIHHSTNANVPSNNWTRRLITHPSFLLPSTTIIKPDSGLTRHITDSGLTRHVNVTELKKLRPEFLRSLGIKRHDTVSSFGNHVDTHSSSTLDNSIIGSLLIGLVALMILVVFFVMLICFMHRWRENMIQS